MTLPARAAIVGAGEIGRGWAALFAAHGVEVVIADPDPGTLDRAHEALEIARSLLDDPSPAGGIRRAASAADAVRGAGWVQESLPDVASLRQEVLAAIAPHAAPDAIIASSSGWSTPDALFASFALASRAIVAHPLHPVYAVPIVELCASARTSPDVLPRAAAVLQALGREPVVLGGETPGFVANRLTAALLREAVALEERGILSAGDIDRLVARGVATGWLVAGVHGTEAIGQGQGPLDEASWARRIAAVLRAARS